jgi:hypothetical protein
MQSSSVMALRIVIMFACMVVLPVLAIFGTSWLDFGNSTTTQARQPFRPAELPRPDQPPAFAASGLSAASSSNPSSVPGSPSSQVSRDPGTAPLAAPLSPRAGEPSRREPVTVSPATTSVPARKGTRGIPQRQRAPGENSRPVSTIVDPAAIPAGYTTASPDDPSQRESVLQAYAPEANNDWFTRAQQRLRELGATYYLLESWGRRGELYRFHCKVAIAGNADYTRHFESTDAEPAQAMQTVLREVEAWRAAR